jgi:hypothetical protein
MVSFSVKKWASRNTLDGLRILLATALPVYGKGKK